MKIKSVLVSVAILLLLGLSVLFLFHKIRQTEQKKEVYHYIPNFQLQDINGNSITSALLNRYTTVIFLFFNPDCDMCREELLQIKYHQEALSKGQIVFFSTLPADSIRHFLGKIDFTPASNMLFLPDEKEILFNAMEVKTSPEVYIYRKNQLIKHFNGQVKIETLINYLSEE